MTIFDTYAEAEEFAEIRLEDSDDGFLYIMKNERGQFLVTGDCKAGKRAGFASYISLCK